ncbi:MAG: flagellar biosynthesis protein FlhB [Deltaproteobacteria bacterium]|nr:flagellar biosynthesis protein FlhB [Deltaproteobacteria bacterium]
MPEGSQDKSEKATPKRRREARRKGNVAKSKELPSVAVLMAGMGVLAYTGSHFYTHLSGIMATALTQAGTLNMGAGEGMAYFHQLALVMAKMLAPVLLAVFVVALLTNYFQVGALLTFEPLMPKLNKINPLSGFKRMFSLRTMVETIKAVCKIIIIAYVAYVTVRGELDTMTTLTALEPIQIMVFILKTAFKIFVRCCVLIFILAVLDYIYQKWQHEKSLRMSKQEIKDEFKQREGDPLVKSRIRQIQRQMAGRRMMEAVPEADVVVTNPIHLAVALTYENSDMEAPQLVAKGAGLVAEKIKELAQKHGVAMVENKPLAQALFRLEVGQVIPIELYQTVAEVLAYVYQVKEKKSALAAG